MIRNMLFASALIAVASTQVLAQTAEPQVPNPTNPYPANPVATDGSSLVGAVRGRLGRIGQNGFSALFDRQVSRQARHLAR